MSDEIIHWSSIIPEINFDVIGKIPPGAFLTLVLVGILAPDPGKIPSALAKLEWGPALGLLLMLLCASYAAGLLMAPIGELVNSYFWRSQWKKIGTENFHLLKAEESRLRLGSSLTEASALTAKDWNTIYSRLHTLLKKTDTDGKLILPKLAAEIQCSSNFIVAFFISGVLVWLRTGFTQVGVLILLLLAFALAIISARKRTSRFVIRHFAYLAAMMGKKEIDGTSASTGEITA